MSRSHTGRPRSLRQVFRTPALLAGLTLVGLIAALVGDDAYDMASWCALAILPAVMAWKIWRR